MKAFAMGHAHSLRSVSSHRENLLLTPLDVLRDVLPGPTRHVDPDEYVTIEGARRDTVVGVVSGLLRCFRVTPDGRRHITKFARAGDLIGLGALKSYRSSTEAVAASTIVTFPVRALNAAADDDAQVREAILDAMTVEMTARDRIQFRLGRLWADERVADFLIELSTEPDGTTRASSPIAMSRADMADHLGITIETVSRALHRFQRQGLVRLDGAHRFTILRGRALRGFAAGDSDDFPQPVERRSLGQKGDLAFAV
jgi:CRP-like cAMP-binding protein